jgi:hypothetical protein
MTVLPASCVLMEPRRKILLYLPDQAPVLNRLAQVRLPDLPLPRQVGDAPRDHEDAGVGSGGLEAGAENGSPVLTTVLTTLPAS